MSRPFVWLAGRLGAATLLTLALLLLVLASVAFGLAGVVRGLDPGLLLPVAILGLLAGWGLAWLPLPGWVAAGLACGLGIEILVLRVGRLGGAVLALAQALAGLVLGVRRWPLDGPPDPGPARLALAELWAGLGTLLVRLRDWLLGLVAGRPAFDPVAAALVWGLALWAVAAWAGWAVRRRRQPLPAVTPAAVMLASGLAYADAGFSILLPVLGATLILLVLVGHDARERRWQAAGIDFSLDIRLDLALVAILLSSVLTAAAWAAPSISIRRLADLMGRISVKPSGGPNPLAGSLGLESGSGSATALREMRVTGLPRGHLIGSGP